MHAFTECADATVADPAATGHHVGVQYSTQANMMGKPTVWPAMAKAFEAATGSLADRLIAALEAAEREGGDIRGRQSAAILIVKAKGSGKPWAGADRVFDLRVEDHPKPVEELKRLVRLQKAYQRANRGDELMTEKKVDEALKEYAAAAQIAPEIVELPFWEAVTLASVGKEAEAAPIFKAVSRTAAPIRSGNAGRGRPTRPRSPRLPDAMSARAPCCPMPPWSLPATRSC